MSENFIPKVAIRESDIHIDTHTREVVKIHGTCQNFRNQIEKWISLNVQSMAFNLEQGKCQLYIVLVDPRLEGLAS